MIRKQLGGTEIILIPPKFEDSELPNYMGTFLQPSMIDIIIDHDADVYSTDGTLLAKFRKSSINPDYQDLFYNAIIKHANKPTSCRGTATASAKSVINGIRVSDAERLRNNVRVKSTIFGYFDKFSPKHKYKMTQQGKRLSPEVRICAWNEQNPDDYLKTLPFLNEIDRQYQRLVPDAYTKQKEKADELVMRVDKTAFTTVTTNVNFQTALHYDKGDDPDGFGNLAVIQRGNYKGGETCFVQYGVGFNVRSGDVLFMNTHRLHGNLPLYLEEGAVRLSVVCYLRLNLWKRTRNWTQEQADDFIAELRSFSKNKSIAV
jgi:hypothetical protein